MKKLTADNVHNTFVDCLADSVDVNPDTVIVKGVLISAAFGLVRLEKHKEDIAAMLLQLPSAFMQNIGGGMSFLNAVVDNEKTQWTDLHEIVDQLICLGLAIDMLAFNANRELWLSLPGGMPYFYVKN